MTTMTRNEAERICSDWVIRVGSPCEATPVKVGATWYMVTSGTGYAPHFAYDAEDVSAWLATRDGKPLFRYADDDTTEYGDFCDSALIQCVEDEPTARALLNEGFRVCASGTCQPIIKTWGDL